MAGETSLQAGSSRWNVQALGQRLLPGLLLACLVAGIAWLIVRIIEPLMGRVAIDALVLALLLGMLVRLFWRIPKRTDAGVAFAGKTVLEFAIVLLGASMDLRAIADAGVKLFGAAVLAVVLAVSLGTFLGRRAGLTPKLAILVAVGNAICGNSAIAAVAPTIRAKQQEVASAIAVTAVLGVSVVLLLPLLVPLVGLSDYQYGVLAGLTVYAVPQVLAATLPVSVESGQIGSLVKLTRVLLLGPVVAVFAFLYRNEHGSTARLSVQRFLPWFLVGFAALAVARTSGLIPASVGGPVQDVSKLLTLVAMAGLGLSVDVRSVRGVGGRVALVVVALLFVLVILALGIIILLDLNG